jgi:hypothetical protein
VADDRVGGRREVPEHEFVDPYPEVVEQADGHQAGVNFFMVEKIEANQLSMRVELTHGQYPHACE